jgi:hypothetical protein
MVCEPCRAARHTECPEAARQEATQESVAHGPVYGLTVTERSGSARCDCHHQALPVRSATLANPDRTTL